MSRIWNLIKALLIGYTLYFAARGFGDLAREIVRDRKARKNRNQEI